MWCQKVLTVSQMSSWQQRPSINWDNCEALYNNKEKETKTGTSQSYVKQEMPLCFYHCCSAFVLLLCPARINLIFSIKAIPLAFYFARVSDWNNTTDFSGGYGHWTRDIVDLLTFIYCPYLCICANVAPVAAPFLKMINYLFPLRSKHYICHKTQPQFEPNPQFLFSLMVYELQWDPLGILMQLEN